MKEMAKVISLKGQYALVKLEKSEVCGGCEICLNKEIKLNVYNEIKAKEGEKVYISVDKMPLYMPIYSYIIPIVTMLVSYLIAKAVFKNETLSIGICFAALFVNIALMYIFFKRKKYRAYIAEIIN